MTNESKQESVKIERNLVREGGLAQRVKELKGVACAALFSAGIYTLGLDWEETIPAALTLALGAYALHREQKYREQQ